LTVIPPSVSGLSRQCGTVNISQPYSLYKEHTYGPPWPVTGNSFIFVSLYKFGTPVSQIHFVLLFTLVLVGLLPPSALFKHVIADAFKCNYVVTVVHIGESFIVF
jgi:hypothetical protein